MDIIEEYRRQFQWRSWREVFDALPDIQGHTVLDLGCGIGDQASALSERGCCVIGIDSNEQLVEFANSRKIKDAKFMVGDIASFDAIAEPVDGIWSSFSAAYFPNKFADTLACWEAQLKVGGWIALTEVDNMFGHHPVSSRTQTLLDNYVKEAISHGRYDFNMGHKLERYLAEANLTIEKSFDIYDLELSFKGPALDDVKLAWEKRFEHMKLLSEFCGHEFDAVCKDFISCLDNKAHDCSSRVCVCIGTKQ